MVYLIKKILSYLGLLVFSFLSFYLTNLSIQYIKSLDPIMKMINEEKEKYRVSYVDALIDDKMIVPGQKGLEVDLEASYKKMKKFGNYNDSLLVFKEVEPVVSIQEHYDYFISRGNGSKKEVSLVFKVVDTFYVEEIAEVLKAKEVVGTFFIKGEVLINNPDIIKVLYQNNQKIAFLDGDWDEVNRLLMTSMTRNIKYCYSDSADVFKLNLCQKNRAHTIIPSINTGNFPYHDLKDKLENGVIIKLDNKRRVVFELGYIINYIRQKDLEIVSLDELLKE